MGSQTLGLIAGILCEPEDGNKASHLQRHPGGSYVCRASTKGHVRGEILGLVQEDVQRGPPTLKHIHTPASTREGSHSTGGRGAGPTVL